MTPFPEVELVTLDRLEVALKNKNMGLLKEGAYKLHEKYHSGHKFEYTDRLKLIYNNVSDDVNVPVEIKDILCSTIKDILFEEGIEPEPVEEQKEPNRVSSLTQLSYNATKPETPPIIPQKTSLHEEKISAFDVFGTPKNEEAVSSYVHSPFQEEKEPFQEFKMPEENRNNSLNNYTSKPILEAQKQETIFKEEEKKTIGTLNTTPEPSCAPVPFDMPAQEPVETKLDTVSLFYCQDVSNEKIKNILRYRELISKLHDEHNSINEILNLISEINTQSNTNILEIKTFLDQLQINNNKVNLITNSTSANLIGLMDEGKYSYSLFKEDENEQINLVPVFGLSNQFICSDCGEIYLDKEDKINPLVLQCPKCKNPMFPNFYTADNQNIQINLEYYNNALLSLVNSDIWVVIHPILEDRVMSNLILSAIKLTSRVKKIYILDKDINIREDFKKRFLSMKNDVEINVNISAHEDFINSIK